MASKMKQSHSGVLALTFWECPLAPGSTHCNARETKFLVNLSMWRYLDHNTKENKEVEDIHKIFEKLRWETFI